MATTRGRFLHSGQPTQVSSLSLRKLLPSLLVMACWLLFTSLRFPSTCIRTTRTQSSLCWVVDTTIGESLHWLLTGGWSTSIKPTALPTTVRHNREWKIPMLKCKMLKKWTVICKWWKGYNNVSCQKSDIFLFLPSYFSSIKAVIKATKLVIM